MVVGEEVQGQEDFLESRMTTHSSILAWKISWTERSLVGSSLYRITESDTTEGLTLSLHFFTSFLNVLLISPPLFPPPFFPSPFFLFLFWFKMIVCRGGVVAWSTAQAYPATVEKLIVMRPIVTTTLLLLMNWCNSTTNYTYI